MVGEAQADQKKASSAPAVYHRQFSPLKLQPDKHPTFETEHGEASTSRNTKLTDVLIDGRAHPPLFVPFVYLPNETCGSRSPFVDSSCSSNSGTIQRV